MPSDPAVGADPNLIYTLSEPIFWISKNLLPPLEANTSEDVSVTAAVLDVPLNVFLPAMYKSLIIKEDALTPVQGEAASGVPLKSY
jgi:hypothetical protein